MPIYMRIGKLRGATSKDAMPIGPFRTSTVPVNIRDLDRFEAGDEVTPESLVEKRLIKNTKTDVKLLGVGELSKKLTVRVHAVSATAREKIEAAGGTVELLREPKVRSPVTTRPSRRRPPRRHPAAGFRRRAGRRGRGRRRARRVLLARQRLARPGAAPARPLHRRRPRGLPARLLGPRAGHRPDAIQSYFSGAGGGGVLKLLNLFSGSALSRFSLFALGIMPYVTASIILQLLTVVVPTLERLQKEGEAGYAKITQYTRYLTMALAAAQSLGYAFLFKRQGALPNVNAGKLVIIVLTLTAGTALLMWMGELITKRGIGNGISLLIFASILAYAPTGISAWVNGGTTERLFFPLVALVVVVAVVFVQEGQRRIPVQYASRQLGNRQTTGGSTYMPLRVNMAGVIPVIFAAALLALPSTAASFVPRGTWVTRTSSSRAGRTSSPRRC